MTTGRFAEVVRQLAASGIDDRPLGEAIGRTCAAVLDTPHAGLFVLDGESAPTVLASSTPLMATLEELELTLGVGPCSSACRLGTPIAEPDLELADPARWPGFNHPAMATGARSAFGFPLVASGRTIGSLNLARGRPGPLTDGQHHDATMLAFVLGQLLITQDSVGRATTIDGVMEHQAVVHQATGMVGAQLGVSMATALAVLRARAFSTDRSTTDVADDVVRRWLRFS